MVKRVVIDQAVIREEVLAAQFVNLQAGSEIERKRRLPGPLPGVEVSQHREHFGRNHFQLARLRGFEFLLRHLRPKEGETDGQCDHHHSELANHSHSLVARYSRFPILLVR